MSHLFQPTHPGEFVRMEVIEPLGLTVTDAAQALGVTRQAVSALLNGRASLSAEMAIRLEKAFGLKMETLLQMQTAFDIAAARQNAASIKVKAFDIKAYRRAAVPA